MTLKELRSIMNIWAGKPSGDDSTILLQNAVLNIAQDKFSEFGIIRGMWAKCDADKDRWDYKNFGWCKDLLRVYAYDSENTYFKPLTPIEISTLNNNDPEWKNLDSVVVPTHYYLDGSRLGMYPPFDADGDEYIWVEYLRLPDTLVDDGDISLIPKQYHRYLAEEAFTILYPLHDKSKEFKRDLQVAYALMEKHNQTFDRGKRVVREPISEG